MIVLVGDTECLEIVTHRAAGFFSVNRRLNNEFEDQHKAAEIAFVDTILRRTASMSVTEISASPEQKSIRR
jgi:hypothetical protein